MIYKYRWCFLLFSLLIFVQQGFTANFRDCCSKCINYKCTNQPKPNAMAAIPTITLDEISEGIEKSNPVAKKVLSGILNDYMDLIHGTSTPYTTGKQVLPSETTVTDVQEALNEPSTEKKYKEMFVIIRDVYKSGDLTPRSKNDGTWDPKLKPVLVMVRPNHK